MQFVLHATKSCLTAALVLLGVVLASPVQAQSSPDGWYWRPERPKTSTPTGAGSTPKLSDPRTGTAMPSSEPSRAEAEQEQTPPQLQSPPRQSSAPQRARPAVAQVNRPVVRTASTARPIVSASAQESMPLANRSASIPNFSSGVPRMGYRPGMAPAPVHYQGPTYEIPAEEIPSGYGMPIDGGHYSGFEPFLPPNSPCGGDGCNGGNCSCGPDCGCGSFGNDCGCNGCGPSCGQSCGGSCGPCGGCDACCGFRWIDTFSVGVGVHGFKGPVDQGENGNFGYHIDLNWGAPIWNALGLGMQVGYGFERSNFVGDYTGGPGEDRTQHFITAGLFKRACGAGLQYGMVFDWLADDYYMDNHLAQLRGEISFVGYNGREIGLMGMFAVNDDGANENTEVAVLDQYLAFFRKRFCNGGEGRVFAGVSGQGNGILGGDVFAPVGNEFAFQAGFVFASSDGSRDDNERDEEYWALGMNVVWYPGKCLNGNTNRYRPLFNVGNNINMLLDHPQH